MRVYLSGPMSGHPDFNYPAFHAAARAWRSEGHDVINPAENHGGRTDLPLADYYATDLPQVCRSEAVAVLPGWEFSAGCRLEVTLASHLGLKVLDSGFPTPGAYREVDAGGQLGESEFNAYQREALRTAAHYPAESVPSMARLIRALGLAGEAGEVADIIKKEIGHGHPENRDEVRGELGDVLWYLATLADSYGLTLAEVVAYNIGKLRRRYPVGFSSERSQHREGAAA